MRILVSAFTCCPPGKPGFTGGEDVLGWNLIQQISKNHVAWVITNAEDRISIEDTVKQMKITGIQFEFIGLPSWLRPLLSIQGGHQIYYYLWQVKALFTAQRLNKLIKFELFHHITYANDWMASYIGAFLNTPYVRGPGGGAHKTPKILQREYPITGRLWELIRSIGQWAFRHDPVFIRGHNKAGAILVCNQDSQDILPDKWKAKSHIFPVSGVSDEDFVAEYTCDSGNNPKSFVVLSAGSLLRIKGFGLALKAFRDFSMSNPDALFKIIGSGPEEQKLKKLSRSLNLNDKVIFHSEIPRSELLTEMATCQVLLFPSMRDGGGTVVVEAMSLGKPVICLDIGGPGMHITDECGFKITPRSPDETVKRLSDALETLYSDEVLRRQLGIAARERVEKCYKWGGLGDRLSDIYNEVSFKSHQD